MDTNDNAVTEAAVREALGLIIDPEYGIPITDLGLVHLIEIRGGRVEVALVLTTPGCPAGDLIQSGAMQAVARIPGVTQADAYIVWEPEWTPERMSLRARVQLGWEG